MKSRPKQWRGKFSLSIMGCLFRVSATGHKGMHVRFEWLFPRNGHYFLYVLMRILINYKEPPNWILWAAAIIQLWNKTAEMESHDRQNKTQGWNRNHINNNSSNLSTIRAVYVTTDIRSSKLVFPLGERVEPRFSYSGRNTTAKKVIRNRGALIVHKEPSISRHSSSIFR